ncbi:MAG: PTS sugar transporter subunit IIB [Bacillota bacterium]|nr:MAG: PTS sugar transporter subunit IIB [Bacillota bacterium]
MIRILLVCAAGMSTSLLVQKMEKVAAARNLDVKIEAHPVSEFQDTYKDFDVILLGPQVRFRKAEWAPLAAELGIPLDVINPVDYGTVNAEKVLDTALKLAATRK